MEKPKKKKQMAYPWRRQRYFIYPENSIVAVQEDYFADVETILPND